jgi:hypothetical protein
MSHGTPSPPNTFTEFEPVTLPIELSAYLKLGSGRTIHVGLRMHGEQVEARQSTYLSSLAAFMDAKRSGRDVPSATNVIAVIEGVKPIWHPIWLAKSEMKTTWHRTKGGVWYGGV